MTTMRGSSASCLREMQWHRLKMAMHYHLDTDLGLARSLARAAEAGSSRGLGGPQPQGARSRAGSHGHGLRAGSRRLRRAYGRCLAGLPGAARPRGQGRNGRGRRGMGRRRGMTGRRGMAAGKGVMAAKKRTRCSLGLNALGAHRRARACGRSNGYRAF